jgi:hypothetical protein
MSYAFQPRLIPERVRRSLDLWEKEILSGLYGGDTFAEIRELGYTDDDIHHVIRLTMKHGLVRRGRGPYRTRFTTHGRRVVEAFRRERDAFEANGYRPVTTPCPLCGKPRLGLLCWDEECYARRRNERLPATDAGLQQQSLLP